MSQLEAMNRSFDMFENILSGKSSPPRWCKVCEQMLPDGYLGVTCKKCWGERHARRLARASVKLHALLAQIREDERC